MDILEKAHIHCRHNRAEVQESKLCGCFYCRQIFDALEINEYVDEGDTTVLCPRCHIDAIIGDNSGIKLTLEFLEKMYSRWFDV